MTDDDLLAAEYALGVLDTADHSRADQRARADPVFRSAVAEWSARLAPMLDEAEPVEPPAAVWQAIRDRLPADVAQPDNVVRFRRQARRWRMLAGGATALAASLALALLVRPQDNPGGSTPVGGQAALVATIGDPGLSQPKLVASWIPESRQLVMVVTGLLPAPAGRVHELWVIPAGGKARSLGVMPSTPRMQLVLSEQKATLLTAGAALAVSVEPPGGSPTGQATGAVVALGKLAST